MAIFNTVYGGEGWQPGSNLVAYYPLNGDWKDHKGDLGYTGTMHDCTQRNSFTYSYTTGKVGNCLSRTNSGNASLNTGITLSNKFSIMFWLNAVTVSGWGVYLTTKTSDGGYGLSAQFSNASPGVKVYTSHYASDTTITTNTWHHYVITQDGTSLVFYVDGVGKSFTVDGTAGPNTLQIAGIFDSGTQGKFDEIYVYDGRILTDKEINRYIKSVS